MRVLLLCEHVSATRWSGSAWAEDLARGLCERGHSVVVACDGASDPTRIAPATILRRAERRRQEHRRPLAFARWAGLLVARGCQDVSLSLSPLVSADVWCPVEPGAAHYIDLMRRRNSLASMGMALTHTTWLPESISSEPSARRRGIHAPLGLASSRGGLGYASSLDPASATDDLRARTRAMLGISESRRVLVMSGVHHDRPGIDEMLAGLARLARDPGAPLLLVLGREGYSVHARARRAGCESLLRLLGGTSRIDAALAAADAALAPLARADDASTGRFVSDCLRLGVPVIADADAPGIELIEPTAFGAAAVGLVIAKRDAGTWAEAISRLLTPEWLEPSRRAARDVGATLSMASLITRLEHVLAKAGRG